MSKKFGQIIVLSLKINQNYETITARGLFKQIIRMVQYERS